MERISLSYALCFISTCLTQFSRNVSTSLVADYLSLYSWDASLEGLFVNLPVLSDVVANYVVYKLLMQRTYSFSHIFVVLVGISLASAILLALAYSTNASWMFVLGRLFISSSANYTLQAAYIDTIPSQKRRQMCLFAVTTQTPVSYALSFGASYLILSFAPNGDEDENRFFNRYTIGSWLCALLLLLYVIVHLLFFVEPSNRIVVEAKFAIDYQLVQYLYLACMLSFTFGLYFTNTFAALRQEFEFDSRNISAFFAISYIPSAVFGIVGCGKRSLHQISCLLGTAFVFATLYVVPAPFSLLALLLFSFLYLVINTLLYVTQGCIWRDYQCHVENTTQKFRMLCVLFSSGSLCYLVGGLFGTFISVRATTVLLCTFCAYSAIYFAVLPIPPC